MNSRRAFTLIELLTVVVIVGLIAALLIPAVHSAREAARRVQCASNLKQIAIGVHVYADMAGVLPRQTNHTGWEHSGGWSWPWRAAILAGLEQGAIYNAINVGFGPFRANDTASATRLAVYLCPSETAVDPWAPWAPASYVGNYGRLGDGTITPYEVVSFASITDGTSQTAMLSERLLGLAENPLVLYGSAESPRAIYAAPTADGGCHTLPPGRLSIASGVNGFAWTAAYPFHLAPSSYNHLAPPNTTSCHNPVDGRFASDPSYMIFVGPTGAAPPSSLHLGGVNVAFADGSVKFIKDSVNTQTWRALGTRVGGELMGGE